MSNPLLELKKHGQSVWYDDLNRKLIVTGTLQRMVDEDGVSGGTSNPSIFEKAVSSGSAYDEQMRKLVDKGRELPEIYDELTVTDVRMATDVFRPIYDETEGADGYASLEVSPTIANDTQASIEAAKRLFAALDRPNAMIKIPGTRAGLPAITHCIAAGINVNVTLLFSIERYAEVVEAFLAGMELRLERGLSIQAIGSVASFFVSRVDAKVDALLARTAGHQLLGKIAIANASMAYGIFERTLNTPRWDKLAREGARPQRPLWASTSTKDPRLPDVYYVEALAAPHTVNTLPPETFAAYRDHGNPVIRIRESVAAAPAQLDALAEAGIDLKTVTCELEADGVAKFAASYAAVLAGIDTKAGALAAR